LEFRLQAAGACISPSPGKRGTPNDTDATFRLRHRPDGSQLGPSDTAGMLWFKPSFKKKFGQIKGGWSTSQILDLLGSPTEVEDSEVPLGSNWGSQPELTFQMKAGEPVKQWMFENNGEFYYIWFAQVSYAEEDPWRVTLAKKLSHRLAA
jgi:hypothetical protein